MRPTIGDLQSTILTAHAWWKTPFCDQEKREGFARQVKRIIGMLDPRDMACTYTELNGFITSTPLMTPLPNDCIPAFNHLIKLGHEFKPGPIRLFTKPQQFEESPSI